MPVVQKGRGATNYAQRGMGVKLKEGSGGPSIDLIDLSVTNNGEWTASTGQAYKKVTVNVPSPQLITLSATTNGSWTASAGQAYKTVTVNVPTWQNLIIERNSGSATLQLPTGFDSDLISYGNNFVPTLITCVSVAGVLMLDSTTVQTDVCVPFDDNSTKVLLDGGNWRLLGSFSPTALTLAVNGYSGNIDYRNIRITLFQLQL